MCIAVIGGMDRLGPHYREETKRPGITLRLLPRVERNFTRPKSSGCIILFYILKKILTS